MANPRVISSNLQTGILFLEVKVMNSSKASSSLHSIDAHFADRSTNCLLSCTVAHGVDHPGCKMSAIDLERQASLGFQSTMDCA